MNFKMLVLGCIVADFQILNIRWKALDEIYKIYMLLDHSDLSISAPVRIFFGVFSVRNAKKFAIF